MVSPFRRSLVRALRATRPGAWLVAAPALLGRNGYAGQVGWLRSTVRQSAIDREGRPVPWLVYPAIDLLDGRVRPEWRVFEFGSGHSTLWWAERVTEVVTVEHHEPWVRRMRPRLPPHARLIARPHRPPGPYVRTPVDEGGGFQVVVIDGRERVACVEPAIAALTPDGVVVFDNSDRERYRPGFEALVAAGFRRLDLRGLAPVLATVSQTTIFYRDGNCLEI